MCIDTIITSINMARYNNRIVLLIHMLSEQLYSHAINYTDRIIVAFYSARGVHGGSSGSRLMDLQKSTATYLGRYLSGLVSIAWMLPAGLRQAFSQ